MVILELYFPAFKCNMVTRIGSHGLCRISQFHVLQSHSEIHRKVLVVCSNIANNPFHGLNELTRSLFACVVENQSFNNRLRTIELNLLFLAATSLPSASLTEKSKEHKTRSQSHTMLVQDSFLGSLLVLPVELWNGIAG